MSKIAEGKPRSRGKRLRGLLRAISLNWQSITLVIVGVTLVALNWDWVVEHQDTLWGIVMTVLQVVLGIAVVVLQFVFLMWFLSRSRMYWIQPGETGITFADYKGNPDVLEVSRRVVTLLRGVKKFHQMGGQMSRGLLLIGPPGTGKSYLAQAIASEAGVPFAYLSAPSLQSMWMGVGSLKVMQLYRKARRMAKKHGACVVFIDEIDAIGGARTSGTSTGGMGMGMGGMFGMGNNLLNELLMQMDPPNVETGLVSKALRLLGLRTRKAQQPVVFTMGATNTPEVLDKALLRPGRFDKKIRVDLPDYEGRKEIITYYLAKVKHDPLMNIDRMASDTIEYSPAEIKFVVNEAVVTAHFAGRESVTYQDFRSAVEFHEWGLRQPIRAMSQEDRRRIAYHEAGHCVAMYLLEPNSPPVKATIVRHTGFLGAVQPKPLEERVTMVREELLADIQVSLASRAAERLFLGTEMTGVTGDLSHATRVAAAYIGALGMGGSLYSNLAFGQTTPDPKQKAQIEKLLDEQYQAVSRLLTDHEGAVHAISNALLERDELDKDEIRDIIEATRLPGGSVAAD